MSVSNAMIDKDILLDENAFEIAAERLQTLSENLRNLKKRIERLLLELKEGFDTPAGEKFIASYGSNLLQPLDDQALVITHVSENLRNARSSYASVFAEYRALNNAIQNIQE